MKEGIHPKYEQTTIRCACGNVFTTGSTKKDIKVEICSKSRIGEMVEKDHKKRRYLRDR